MVHSDSHSLPFHTCFLIIATTEGDAKEKHYENFYLLHTMGIFKHKMISISFVTALET